MKGNGEKLKLGATKGKSDKQRTLLTRTTVGRMEIQFGIKGCHYAYFGRGLQ